jgi:membrane protein DedA with SNARE-associated domain
MGFRVPVSVACGVAQMPFWRFTAYTFLGVAPWTWFFVWVGYQMGRIWEHPAWRPFWRIAWIVLGVIAAALWVRAAVKRKHRLESDC